MAADGIPYTGFLYAGLMIDATGTPEGARVQLPARRPGDAADHGAAEVRPRRPAGARASTARSTRRRGRVGPARRARRRARRGRLPGGAAQGRRDRRPRARDAQAHPDCHVFHAGTALADGAAVVSGGRVLCVTALGDSVRQAQRAAYARHRRDPFRRHAVPQRHRPSRPRPAQGLSARRCAGAAARNARRPGDNRAFAPIDRPRMDITAPRQFFLTLQGRIVAALEALDGGAVPARRLGRGPKGGGGISRLIEDGRLLRARRRQLLARDGRQAAAVGNGAPAGDSPAARGRRWACRWCCIRATPTCRPCT